MKIFLTGYTQKLPTPTALLVHTNTHRLARYPGLLELRISHSTDLRKPCYKGKELGNTKEKVKGMARRCSFIKDMKKQPEKQEILWCGRRETDSEIRFPS